MPDWAVANWTDRLGMLILTKYVVATTTRIEQQTANETRLAVKNERFSPRFCGFSTASICFKADLIAFSFFSFMVSSGFWTGFEMTAIFLRADAASGWVVAGLIEVSDSFLMGFSVVFCVEDLDFKSRSLSRFILAASA